MGALNTIHMASLEKGMAWGLKMLSEKMKQKVLEGQVEQRNQPTRKALSLLAGRKRERKENEVNRGSIKAYQVLIVTSSKLLGVSLFL